MKIKVSRTRPGQDLSDEALRLREEFPPGSEVMLSIDRGPIETWYIVGVMVPPDGGDGLLMVSTIDPIGVPEDRIEELIARTMPIHPDKLRGKKMRMQ